MKIQPLSLTLPDGTRIDTFAFTLPADYRVTQNSDADDETDELADEEPASTS